MDRAELEKLVRKIIDCAYRVHSGLGPGMLEQSYEICLMHELDIQGIHTRRQVALPIKYRSITLDGGYRIDLLVANEVIVEVKAVEKIIPVHKAQLLSYLRMAEKKIGLLINFNSPRLSGNINRVVNGL